MNIVLGEKWILQNIQIGSKNTSGNAVYFCSKMRLHSQSFSNKLFSSLCSTYIIHPYIYVKTLKTDILRFYFYVQVNQPLKVTKGLYNPFEVQTGRCLQEVHCKEREHSQSTIGTIVHVSELILNALSVRETPTLSQSYCCM